MRVAVTMTFDPDLLARIDRAAREDGTNRSAWLADSAEAKLVWRDRVRLGELLGREPEPAEEKTA